MKSQEVAIEVAPGTSVAGTWSIPPGMRGVVLFAHGSGSSRFSRRNAYVASVLQSAGFATLLLDLLTRAEERVDDLTAELRFDIDFLAARVKAAIGWVTQQPSTRGAPLGLFGASTGAAAALVAAAARPDDVSAVVSRGGRPDLAHRALATVRAPTLLIVGGDDTEVLQLNQEALMRLNCHKELAVVPGATHLFEEPGALEQVASLAERWFDHFLIIEAGITSVERS